MSAALINLHHLVLILAFIHHHVRVSIPHLLLHHDKFFLLLVIVILHHGIPFGQTLRLRRQQHHCWLLILLVLQVNHQFSLALVVAFKFFLDVLSCIGNSLNSIIFED